MNPPPSPSVRRGAGMEAELREAPAVLNRQAQALSQPIADLVRRLKRQAPAVVVTCARGSSGHAATFAKHLIERHLGIPVAAAAPSLATAYRRELQLANQLFLGISQSGSSDDLVAAAAMARSAGALTVALVNEPRSALADICEIVLPMTAGPERSVAATKTFVASLAALLRLMALWTGNEAMCSACDRLPERVAQATALDWDAALVPLARAGSAMTIGRGPTLAIAREAALKLKETCALPAEAFSSAEVRHGPIALLTAGYPLIVFAPSDQAALGLPELIAAARRIGACVLSTMGNAGGVADLPILPPDHPDADAICLVQSFYALLVALAQKRGANADAPPNLQKVTRTQ